MKGNRYGITEEIYELNGEKRTAYGIALYANSDSDGTATVLLSAQDVSANKESLEALVEACNRLELSPIHFFDIIEDFLTVN